MNVMKWVKRMAARIPDVFRKVLIRRQKIGAWILNFLWFVAIVLVCGQLGPLLSVGAKWWQSSPILMAIRAQAQVGQFVTFSTALLASSSYFVVREYNQNEQIDRRKTKSLLMLVTVALGFVGILIAFQLTRVGRFDSLRQEFTHWVVYVTSVLVAVVWWSLQEFVEPAKKAIAEIGAAASGITEKAKKETTTRTNIPV